MDKFKVGDRVRIVKPMLNSRHAGIGIGDIGTIINTWENGYQGKSGAFVQLDWFFNEDLPEKLLKDSEFNIGNYTYQMWSEELELIKEEII